MADAFLYASAVSSPPKGQTAPTNRPHFHGLSWVLFILSDIIGLFLVRLEGFELSTPGSGDQCSIH